jgi:hypothetical protein
MRKGTESSPGKTGKMRENSNSENSEDMRRRYAVRDASASSFRSSGLRPKCTGAAPARSWLLSVCTGNDSPTWPSPNALPGGRSSPDLEPPGGPAVPRAPHVPERRPSRPMSCTPLATAAPRSPSPRGRFPTTPVMTPPTSRRRCRSPSVCGHELPGVTGHQLGGRTATACLPGILSPQTPFTCG